MTNECLGTIFPSTSAAISVIWAAGDENWQHYACVQRNRKPSATVDDRQVYGVNFLDMVCASSERFITITVHYAV